MQAGEKVTLGISILLSLVVFLLLVSKILPPTSLVLPLIAKYLLFTFIMNTVSILVTVVIINWNFRGPRTHSMPNWIRVVFIKYLPIFLFMRRPKKTRLRWMMEMQGQTARRLPPPTAGYDTPERRGPSSHSDMRPPHFSPPPPELPKHLSRGPSREHIPEQMKNKIEVMELSDMHNPTCKLHASQSFEDHSPVRERRGSDVSDIFLSPEAYKATQAVEFIAEHLRNEDEYVQIREDWKYVAMVVDRAQLWLFFLVTTIGTVGILMDAPHIFEFVDQDRIIDIYRGK